MQKSRIFVPLVGLCMALVAALGQAIAADEYPAKPIRFIILATPGGLNDIVARAYGQQLSKRLGQPVLVESRPGGGGVVGMVAAAKSEPDGYTIVMVYPGVMSVLPHLNKSLPYDPQRDFVAVAQIASYPMVLMVNPDLPAKSLQELIQLAKTKPGGMSYGSSGNATTSNLAMELLKRRAGIDLVHVAYKGEAPAHNDLLAGHVPVAVSTLTGGLSLIRSGRVRALGVTSKGRSPFAPDIPTISESGVPDFEVTGWLGVSAPAGTPKPVVERLSRELNAIANESETRERLATQGTEPVGTSSEVFGKWIRDETKRWGELITSTGIKVN